MIQKIFSKSAFKIAGITYLLMAITGLLGYLRFPIVRIISFDFIFLVGICALYVSPIIIIASIIYIIINVKSKYVLLGYLILTIGVIGVTGGTAFAINKVKHNAYNLKQTEENRQRREYINNTVAPIAPVIKDVYLNAQFSMDWEFQTVVVKLGGYKYENQPNFDDEIVKWKEIKQNNIFVNYPHKIRIEYYFENTRDRFAVLYLSNFNLHYYSLGMSKEGIAQIKSILQEHISNYHDDFKIKSDYSFDISIYKVLHNDEETDEAILWQDFVRTNYINTELVKIKVAYRNPDDYFSARYYEIGRNIWSGNY